MDLEQDAGFVVGGEGGVQPEHGEFDDVGGGALDGMVDGFALGAEPGLTVAAAPGL